MSIDEFGSDGTLFGYGLLYYEPRFGWQDFIDFWSYPDVFHQRVFRRECWLVLNSIHQVLVQFWRLQSGSRVVQPGLAK